MGTESTTDRCERVRATIETHGQAHLLRFFDDLDEAGRRCLLGEIEAIDFIALDRLIDTHVRSDAPHGVPSDLEPAPYYPLASTDDAKTHRDHGETLVREGRVAAFTVAGGQGTRLGWNGPKGTYPATPVTGKPLFRIFAEQIRAAEDRYGVDIPWYVMTSPANDQATRAFFADNNHFGLSLQKLFFFPQGTIPSLEPGSGRILLADRGEIALNPDGHGGSLKALAVSGALADMRARGVEHISYFQVDNPLVRVIDPLFIGLHAGAPDSSGEISSKMVAKTGPEERVGVFCRAGGKTMVIEYSDLPGELAEARDACGRLRFIAGSIAVHMLGVEFVERLTKDAHAFALPFHRALKKVAHVDPETAVRVDPTEPNAVKLETFVFDAIPLASSSIVLEADRAEEFAPIKNADGVDSSETSHRLQSDRAARWLEANGVSVPRDADGHADAKLEISPLTALEPGDLAGLDLPSSIAAGTSAAL
jgi:UDP-N-acetylglucosamine/UDP-N-acetylgalactosamine diphosphorylase